MASLGDDSASDALRELGNVAFSHAATALARLVGRRVDVGIPNVHVLDREEASEDLGRQGGLHVVSFRLSGDHSGVLAVVLPEADAGALLGLLGASPARGGRLDADAESALLEIGNIMAGSALLALHRMLGATLLHGTPLLRRLAALRPADPDLFPGPLVLVLEAEFTVEGRHAHGTMAISPGDPAPLLARLGVPVEAAR